MKITILTWIGITDDTKNSTANTTSNYTVAKASTVANDTTFMGITSTAWTWIILAVAAILIIALIWYYSVQVSNNKNDYDDKD